MHLTSLAIPVHDLKFADYFQAVLGLRVETPRDTTQIHLGTTTLELNVDPSTDEGVWISEQLARPDHGIDFRWSRTACPKAAGALLWRR